MFATPTRRRKKAVPGIRHRRAPVVTSRYAPRLARTAAEVEAALRLRFDVFNCELGEGLAASSVTGLDRDEFDVVCDHLLVADELTGEIVGTYRLQTAETAAAGLGFSSAREFQLEALPADLLRASVELGRACIARPHRNTRVLLALWRGIAAYASRRDARLLFGCCSIAGTDPSVAAAAEARLRQARLVHPDLWAPTTPSFACPRVESGDTSVAIPQLFGMYMRHGARVCGGPAIDRAFGTTDFLVVLDVASLESRAFELFFA
jgi:putative hemolysin